MEQSIFKPAVMTELVRKFPTPAFLGRTLFKPKQVVSTTATWDVIKMNRNKVDGWNARGAESKKVARLGRERKTAELGYIFLSKPIPGDVLNLLQPGSLTQLYGEQAVRDELEDLNSLVEFLAEWARWQALTTGQIVVDQDDIKFTVDYGVDATHRPTAALSWAIDTTDIITDIRTWKLRMAQDSGVAPTKAYTTETVMGYMIANLGVREMMGESTMKEQIARSGYITRFMGLDIEVYDAGYVDGGTFYPFIGEDKFLITAGGDFGREYEGLVTDPKAQRKPGKFSKSWQEEDPPSVHVSIEWAPLPVLTKVENILCADVVP